MKILSSGRHGLGTLAAIVLLAGCGGSGLQSQLDPPVRSSKMLRSPTPIRKRACRTGYLGPASLSSPM